MAANTGYGWLYSRHMHVYGTKPEQTAHTAEAVRAFHETAAKAGLKVALEQRDAPFGDNRGRKSD